MLGNVLASDASPVLAARQSAAAALSLWVDSEAWKPPVMPRLFARGTPLSNDMAALAAQVSVLGLWVRFVLTGTSSAWNPAKLSLAQECENQATCYGRYRAHSTALLWRQLVACILAMLRGRSTGTSSGSPEQQCSLG